METGLKLPLEILHILDRHPERSIGEDHSGAIGMEAQNALMATLVEREAVRSKAAREQGRVFLSGLRQRALERGVEAPSLRQRYGELEATLVEPQESVELFVLGRRGESAESTGRDLGRNLERVVRALRRPILTVTEPFREPQRVLIAFDGRAAARRGIDLVVATPLFHALACDIVMAGKPGRSGAELLESARGRLAATGMDVTALLLPGDPELEIVRALRERAPVATSNSPTCGRVKLPHLSCAGRGEATVLSTASQYVRRLL